MNAVFSPLDEQLQIQDPHTSEAVSKLLVWLSGLLPYEQVEVVLERVGQIHCSRNTAWRRAQRWGEAMRQAEAAEQARASQIDTRGGAVAGEAPQNDRLGASVDGFLIHVREEGWKEVKAGSIFRIEPEAKADLPTQESLEVGRAVDNSYVAHLGGPEGLGEKLWSEAKRRGWTRAAETQVVADGAAWIWNLVADHFYDSVQVVDWYHAKSHLAHAAQVFYGEATPGMHRWLNVQTTHLFQGQAAGIAQTLRKMASQHPAQESELLTEAGYFDTHKRRMEYLDRRMEGWILGSGMVESAAKQYQARFKGPGMQWSRLGAERLLPVRTAILSHRFDEIWQRIYNPPLN